MKFTAIFFLGLCVSSVGGADNRGTARRRTQAETNKQIATDFVQASLIEFDVNATRDLIGPNYIQHNPGAPTGPDVFLSFLPGLEAAGLITKPKRILAEGDLVVFHNTYKKASVFGLADVVIAFDVFRIENGLVDEHWDNIQNKTGPNPSGRTMIGGRTRMKDLGPGKTQSNKQLVLDFIQNILIDGTGAVTDYISTEVYKQHNPNVGDGLTALGEALENLAAIGQSFVYDEVKLVVAENDFVFAASEGSQGGVSKAFFDLFRVQQGLIVEHWDVIQDIPPPEEFAHGNGKF